MREDEMIFIAVLINFQFFWDVALRALIVTDDSEATTTCPFPFLFLNLFVPLSLSPIPHLACFIPYQYADILPRLLVLGATEQILGMYPLLTPNTERCTQNFILS
jgi:hypothetical protein